MSKGESNTALPRRKFLTDAGLTLLAGWLGAPIVFGKNAPEGWLPIGLEDWPKGKHKDLILLNDRPWNLETPAHLLDDNITPADKMFVRNNGKVPENIHVNTWKLTIEGEAVRKKVSLTLEELKKKFTQHTYQLVLECAGNGRKGLLPPTRGNQWDIGAVSCASWTGVRLKDVLEYAGYTDKAQYIGYYGADVHLTGDSSRPVISRGVPMSKAMDEHNLIAWKMNGDDIPLIHGYPLRLVIGGWPASVSGKWLHTIAIRDRKHDGAKMAAPSYSVPCEPVAPGEKVPYEKMCTIEAMPVRSVITSPKSGGILKGRQQLDVRGHAWAGDTAIQKVEVSVDFGATWTNTDLKSAANLNAWQQWSTSVNFPGKGYYEVWVKATDAVGNSQPVLPGAWNPKGYVNNSVHRIAIKVA
jgi:sulfite oxidase